MLKLVLSVVLESSLVQCSRQMLLRDTSSMRVLIMSALEPNSFLRKQTKRSAARPPPCARGVATGPRRAPRHAPTERGTDVGQRRAETNIIIKSLNALIRHSKLQLARDPEERNRTRRDPGEARREGSVITIQVSAL